ncbi:MAG: PD-(D/E)XK nuclease family protein, partial [Rubrimonas sp.]
VGGRAPLDPRRAAGPGRPPGPAPRPPLAHRPATLSATQIETLIRDPFAIYAREVLRLKALDPVGRELDARDRGNTLHKVLEALAVRAATGEPLEDALGSALDDELAKARAGETQRRLWRARILRAAPVLLRDEAVRQSLGSPRVEVTGSRGFANFTLTARADRIDLRDGAVAIYDYKTGSAPSDREVRAFAKQLPLEAAIAEAGGFRDIPPARVVELAHVVLSGESAGAARPLNGDPAALAAEAWEGLMRLVASYADPRTGYPARARPRHITHDGDYDHLSRYGEWEDGDPAEDAVA